MLAWPTHLISPHQNGQQQLAPEGWKHKILNNRFSEFLNFQVTRFPNSQICKFPDFQIPKFPNEFSDPNLTPCSKFDPKQKSQTQNKIQNPKQKSARSETSYLAEQSTCAGAIQICSRTLMGLFLQALHSKSKKGVPHRGKQLGKLCQNYIFLKMLILF